jgi:hypothetical protein
VTVASVVTKWIGILNDLFYDLAISQDRQRCQFLFLLDEKPTVVPVGSVGEQSGGAQEVSYGAVRLVRGLAVTSPKRSKLQPEIPTVAESGVSTYSSVGWIVLLAPAKTPADIVLESVEKASDS